MQSAVVSSAPVSAETPVIRDIGFADLKDALREGLADFWAMPTHIVFLGLIYPVVGLVLARFAFGYDVLPLLFPLAAGFALVGPLAGVWLYELSRRREQGLDVGWRHAFDVLYSPSLGAIAELGLLMVAIFVGWLAAAQAIYVANFGHAPAASMPDFVNQVLTTAPGWTLIVVGNAVGFIFALAAFLVSVVSFPMLVDRHTSATAAVLTSMRAVAKNPVMMAVWGLIVTALLVLGSIPFFLGLAVVVPVLGHATWHLYRKVVEPMTAPIEEYPRPPERKKSAADFPAALFPSRREGP